MSYTPGRGHAALRRGRWSSAGADYFLTICTKDRAVGLAAPPVATAIANEAHRLAAQRFWHLRTFTVMPDHMHLFVTLGADADVAVVIRLLKGRVVPARRAAALRWQRGCFDHRMRTNEDRLPVFSYIFLNPYRAGLIAPPEKWPSYYCSTDDWKWFEPLTNAECPFPDWLA